MSSTKSNGSVSTTLKKVVPQKVYKPVRSTSHEAAQAMTQHAINQKLLSRVRTQTADKTVSGVGNISGAKNLNKNLSAAPKNVGLNQNTGNSSTTKTSENIPAFMQNIQQRNLHKQFESIDMKPAPQNKKGSSSSFVVNSLQTANQRASSKSSSGSAASFIHKLTSNSATQKAGVQIAQSGMTGSTSSGSGIPISSIYKKDNFMSAKQNELTNLIQKVTASQIAEGFGQASGFHDQHNKGIPTNENINR